MSHVLVVDDEPAICWGFRELLREDGHEVTIASSAEDALLAAERTRPDAILLDVRLPGMDGLTALKKLRARTGDVPVIVITAFGSLETAVKAVDAGAFDYLTKPFELDDAAAIIRRALNQSSARHSLTEPTAILAAETPLVGSSAAMQAVFKQIALVARSDVPVLISGESGTGKETVARTIHQHSQRGTHPFVTVNLEAIGDESLEAELCGHRAEAGLLARADSGTLFLESVDQLSLPAQARLLQLIEHPMNSPDQRLCDIRIVASSARDLSGLVDEKSFRADLYYHLSVVRIELPPLRSRRDDIPDLARCFLRQTDSESSRGFSPAALCELTSRNWPGNLRELRNVVNHAAAMSRAAVIDTGELPESPSGARHLSSDPLLREVARWVADQTLEVGSADQEGVLYEHFIETVEPTLLRVVLEQCQNNRAAAARLLGLHRATLRQKLRRYDLDDVSSTD